MRLGQSNRNSIGKDSNVMSPNDVMQVASGVPTPWNPGDSKEIRTEKVVTTHRNFSHKEADELRIKAASRQRQAKVNRKAYQALRKIETADVSDQAAFRGYQTTVARAAATKKRADVGKAKTLHSLTPAYAQMGYSLGAAHDEAKVRVAELQALHTEVDQRWR